MTLPVVMTYLVLSASPAVSPAVLHVTLAPPPACSGPLAHRPVGSIPVPRESAVAEFRVSLCDGRTLDLRTEISRDGEAFGVVAINRADSSMTNSYLLAGQSFDAVLSSVRLRFTLVDPVAAAR